MRNKFYYGQRRVFIIFLVILPAVLLSGCLTQSTSAPVINAQSQPAAKSGYYRVKKGDTLYSIAWAYGFDYRALAETNRLAPPYRIKPGRLLRLAITTRSSVVKKSRSPVAWRFPRRTSSTTSRRSWRARWRSPSITAKIRGWRWPARGRVIERYSAALGGNKGINIAGRLGEPVHASAAGVVVYSGSGVRGYGNLIILKNNDNYLSAYAYNKRLLVHLGSRVRKGQMIAEMGRDNAGKVMLHFEIRRNGKPVNPLRYLPAHRSVG